MSRYCTWFRVGEFVPIVLCADWVVTGTWLPTSKVAGLFSITTIDGLLRMCTFDTESSADRMRSWLPAVVPVPSPPNPNPKPPNPLFAVLIAAAVEAIARPSCAVACRLTWPGMLLR